MSAQRILRGPIMPALATLAWPVIAGEALHTAFHVVDLLWVGPLGPWATGGVMTSTFTLWISFSLMNLVTIGVTAHVSRAIGAGDRAHAAHAAGQSLWTCAVLSVLVMALGPRQAHLADEIVCRVMKVLETPRVFA